MTLPKVINLSNRTLSTDEIELLKKSLKFCPTPKGNNSSELKSDILQFCRRLRLNEKFFTEDNEYENESIVRNNSNWVPPKSDDRHLEESIDILKKLPLNKTSNVRSNISYKQRNALNSLQNDKSIVIKEADKGGSVVIMDSSYYCENITKMLQDAEFYTNIASNADTITREHIEDLVSKTGNGLTEDEIDYLTKFTHKTSFFYGLPKIHKSAKINDAILQQNTEYVILEKPDDLKFRPIVGGPQSATNRLSHMLDLILKNMCTCVKSYIRDDFDFLDHLPTSVDSGSQLVTFDVVGLYSNIPHELGIKAIEYWIDKHPDKYDSRFSKDFILQSLKIILERNVFYFNGTYFQQKKGTAMGTKVAPTYATLVLGYLEEILYEKLENKYGREFSEYIQSNFWRFIDDCFSVFLPNMNIIDFHNDLNSLHHDIQYTMESSNSSLSFLDVLVKLEGDSIATDIYCKPTDAHNFLDFHSNHAKHIKVNIPFNLASRLVTIVRNHDTLQKRLQELESYLLKQHYPQNLVQAGIRKALEKGPFTSRTKDNKNGTIVIPFVSTYNPHNYNVFPIIKTCEEYMKNSDRMRRVLSTSQIINSKRQPKNLKRLLCSSRFESSEERNHSVSKCNIPRCGTCSILIEGSSYTFKNGFTFNVHFDMNCKSKNVIYALICESCSEFYIGQTGCELRQRVTVHRQQTKDDNLRFLYVNQHIHTCARNNFKVIPIYQMNTPCNIQRETKESLLISLLKPGLNRCP